MDLKETAVKIDSKIDNKKVLYFGYATTLCSFIYFLVYTIQVKTVNVRAVGEAGSVVGFADVNKFFYDHLGFNKFFYFISEICGFFAIAVMAFFALIGVLSLVNTKSLKKVDYRLYILAGGYFIMLAFYALFEKLIVNYRPLILDGEEALEASYPSSHTFLAIFVFTSACVLFPVFIKKKKIARIASIVSIVLMVVGVLTRFLSGAHWFTDIVGSLLLGAALVSLFTSVLNTVNYKKKR